MDDPVIDPGYEKLLEKQPASTLSVLAARAGWRVWPLCFMVFPERAPDRAARSDIPAVRAATASLFIEHLSPAAVYSAQHNIRAAQAYLANTGRTVQFFNVSSTRFANATALALEISLKNEYKLNNFYNSISESREVIEDAYSTKITMTNSFNRELERDLVKLNFNNSINLKDPIREQEFSIFSHRNDRMKEYLLEKNEGWDVWIEFYTAMERGGPRPHDAAFIRALNDLDLWIKTPAEINAQIRAWVEEERAKGEGELELHAAITPDVLASVASPTAGISARGRLDAIPNGATDKPAVDKDLPTLPLRQKALIETILNSLGKNSPKTLKSALRNYSDELGIRGVQPIVGLLSDMFAVIESDKSARDADEWLQAGLRAAFAAFEANHQSFMRHFPLNEIREEVLGRIVLDERHAPGDAARNAMERFAEAAKAAVVEHVAEPNFSKVAEQHAEALDVVISTPSHDIRAKNGDRLLPAEEQPITFRKRVVASVAGFARSIINLGQNPTVVATATSIQIMESKTFEVLVNAAKAVWQALAPFLGL